METTSRPAPRTAAGTRSPALVLAVGLGLGAPATAAAHAGLTDPPPRTTDSLIQAPCGQGEITGPRTVFEPGQTITVEWEQFIAHSGIFRIAFSPNDDAGFDDNVLGTVDDDPEQDLYALAITLPMCTCDDCTLQLFQTPGAGGYYSCADIELRADDDTIPACTMATVDDGGGGESTGLPDDPPAGATDAGDDAETSGGTTDDAPADADGGSDGHAASDDGASHGCAVGPPDAGRVPWGLASLLLLGSARRRRLGHRDRAAG